MCRRGPHARSALGSEEQTRPDARSTGHVATLRRTWPGLGVTPQGHPAAPGPQARLTTEAEPGVGGRVPGPGHSRRSEHSGTQGCWWLAHLWMHLSYPHKEQGSSPRSWSRRPAGLSELSLRPPWTRLRAQPFLGRARPGQRRAGKARGRALGRSLVQLLLPGETGWETRGHSSGNWRLL